MSGFSDQNLFLAATSSKIEDDCRRSESLGLAASTASLKKTDNLSLSPGNVPLTESESPTECRVQLRRE
jgi:hypothetical protein